MISNRSAWLALAAVTVLCSSCLHSQRASHGHARAVKAEADVSHAQAQALRSRDAEPEYFEGAVPPALPAAQPEERPSAPSSAHVWIPGHHTRHQERWVWVAGHYAVPPRSDVVWVPGHWVSHLHGYAWISGGWR